MNEDVTTIEAAGAVLWRHAPDGGLLIALVHRPRYNDWSLPKGKVEQGEAHIACAFREVLEETGVTAIFGPELGKATYEVDGATKIVRYWAAEASNTPYGQPNPVEVDSVQWLQVPEARKQLTLEDDKSMIDVFVEFGPDTRPLILLRHAKALRRDEWQGDDGDRPLDNIGQRQAKRLLSSYLPFSIDEIHSSDAMRCLETVEPLARSLKINIVISEDLSEYKHTTKQDAAFEYVQEVLDNDVSAILCSHNPVLPLLLRKLIGKKSFNELDTNLKPGESWILHQRDGDIIAIDWMASPTL